MNMKAFWLSAPVLVLALNVSAKGGTAGYRNNLKPRLNLSDIKTLNKLIRQGRLTYNPETSSFEIKKQLVDTLKREGLINEDYGVQSRICI